MGNHGKSARLENHRRGVRGRRPARWTWCRRGWCRRSERGSHGYTLGWRPVVRRVIRLFWCRIARKTGYWHRITTHNHYIESLVDSIPQARSSSVLLVVNLGFRPFQEYTDQLHNLDPARLMFDVCLPFNASDFFFIPHSSFYISHRYLRAGTTSTATQGLSGLFDKHTSD
jgi:hypothetical protein